MDLFILVPIYICGSSAVAKLMWFTLPPHTHTSLLLHTQPLHIFLYYTYSLLSYHCEFFLCVFPSILTLFLSYSLYSTLYIQLIHMANSTVELSLHIDMKICRESYLEFLDISRLLLVKGKVYSVKR